MKFWMLYGAHGYTVKLIAQEAKDRGHSPVLAGCSAENLIPLTEELNLDYIVMDLKNKNNLKANIEGFDLVFHQ
ncbi:hypothetical protein LCGC14_0625390 [marine sediment metagenome]|uniref:Saccharopine dehydrogenase NADP binding domain-containing protein n=1 Tax=marine sediment metagenome TaxID=412755 RepID=A0A0F9R8J9_9ZZZZ|nr:MAG: hypothetical protein Lokiarch_04220 [Candidatus Lokiarchaeum sp. GC14_75]HEA70577.1 hypothetical protein [archaeon]